jgi:nitroreductase
MVLLKEDMNMTELFQFVKTKRSVRQFQDKELPEDAVFEILEAGRRSGSAKNMQPWHFIVVMEKSVLTALSSCGAFAGHLAGATMCIALVTKNPFYRLTVPFDLGRASQNMMLTAWSWGIGSEMATIYNAQKACELLGVPDQYTIPWCIAFGYPLEQVPSPLRKGGRRTVDEVVHFEQW